MMNRASQKGGRGTSRKSESYYSDNRKSSFPCNQIHAFSVDEGRRFAVRHFLEVCLHCGSTVSRFENHASSCSRERREVAP